MVSTVIRLLYSSYKMIYKCRRAPMKAEHSGKEFSAAARIMQSSANELSTLVSSKV